MDIVAETSSESGDERSFVKIDVKGKPNGSKNRGNPAPCPVCGVVISNSYNLTCHLRRHNNDKPFKCDQCPAAFILITELKRHKVTHSKDRPYKCNLCSKSYKCIEILRVHMDSHGCNEYKCRYCDQKFKNYKLRSNHEMSMHTTSNLKCRYCYKSFSEVKFREEHEKASHKKQMQSELHKIGVKSDLMNLTPNEIADLEFNDIKRRKPRSKNKKNSSKENRSSLDTNFAYYPCKFCSERFRYKKDQVAHYEVHHVEEFNKVFKKCEICSKLLTIAHYKGHKQAHDGIFRYKCHLCDYKSTRKSDLDNHMFVHTKDYKYKCSFCQKPFRSLGPSLLCEKKHSGIKDVKCNLCEKTFFSGFDLRKHVMQKHKTRKCQLCNFETTDRYIYDKHRSVHKASESFTKADARKGCSMCDICGFLFSSTRHLTAHLKIHKDINCMKKENYCSYCNYKGSSYADCLDHCLVNHPSKVYKCEVCEYSTLNESVFLNHLKNHISNSAQEMYLYASIDKKFNKEIASVNLECFICGFSSTLIESLNSHIESHNDTMMPFDWYSSDMFYQRLKSACSDDKEKENDSLIKDKKYKTLQIKDISLPVDLCRISYVKGDLDSNKDKQPKYLIDRALRESIEESMIIKDESMTIQEESIDGFSIKAESQDTDDESKGIIEINDTSNETMIKSEMVESNDILIKNKTITKTPVTIKIKKVKCKSELSSLKVNQDSNIDSLSEKLKVGKSPQVNLNLEVLKNKLQNINGKLFLSLDDIFSLSTIS